MQSLLNVSIKPIIQLYNAYSIFITLVMRCLMLTRMLQSLVLSKVMLLGLPQHFNDGERSVCPGFMLLQNLVVCLAKLKRRAFASFPGQTLVK